MIQKLKIEELLEDERVSHAVSYSIDHGINSIIERATQDKSDWLVNYIKRIFEEEIVPLFGSQAVEQAKKKGEPKEWPLNHVKKFWTELSKTFNYDFGELEWYSLTHNTPDGAVYFIEKLCNKYVKKFYPDPKKAINNPVFDLLDLVSRIYNKEIKKNRTGNG